MQNICVLDVFILVKEKYTQTKRTTLWWPLLKNFRLINGLTVERPIIFTKSRTDALMLSASSSQSQTKRYSQPTLAVVETISDVITHRLTLYRSSWKRVGMVMNIRQQIALFSLILYSRKFFKRQSIYHFIVKYWNNFVMKYWRISKDLLFNRWNG